MRRKGLRFPNGIPRAVTTDDLRHRIAYAIAQADGDAPGMKPASCDYEMADAVIEALGLEVTVTARSSDGPVGLDRRHCQHQRQDGQPDQAGNRAPSSWHEGQKSHTDAHPGDSDRISYSC